MIKKPFKIIFLSILIFEIILLNFYRGNSLQSSFRQIEFSGYNWIVRTSNGNLEGPGPNLFNDSLNNVFIDENGFLHLKITKFEDKWFCAEIYSVESFGYGTYIFELEPGFENIDKNIILGLFTYLDDYHEIDIEFSKWGLENNKNGQYVIQPYYKEDNIYRFDLNSNGDISIHSFTWCENYIKFHSEIKDEFNESIKTNQWIYCGEDNPKPSSERVHMNLWLMNGQAPSDNQECEIIIRKFQFISSNCDETVCKNKISAYLYIYLFIAIFLAISLIHNYTGAKKFKNVGNGYGIDK